MSYYIRNIVKKVAKIFGLEFFFTKQWFNYLAYKNGIAVSYQKSSITLSKKDEKIIICRTEKSFGSIGIVVRDFDDFFETLVPNVIQNINVIDFSKPKFHTLKRDNDKFFFHDICEPIAVTDIYVSKAALKEGDIVLDIGSYCGTQTVFFSKLVGKTGAVFAFEPDAVTFQSLSKNIAEHKCSNITALNIGLYSSDGEIGFSGDSGMGASISSEAAFKIKVRRLDAICKEYNLQKIDFIKMDIEGAEIDVLKSSKEVIQKYKPRFIIEPHFIDGILNDNQIIAIFNELNYETQTLKQGSFDYQPLLYCYPKEI